MQSAVHIYQSRIMRFTYILFRDKQCVRLSVVRDLASK